VEPARKRATVEDLLALPSDARVELIAGALVHLPPPLPEHGRGQRTIGRYIGGPFDDDHGRGGPGGWWILPEVEVELGADVVRPDVAGWRRERLPSPSGMRPIRVVPDWICEALSPSNERHDRVYKADLYGRHGVALYWIIDPGEQILEAFELHEVAAGPESAHGALERRRACARSKPWLSRWIACSLPSSADSPRSERSANRHPLVTRVRPANPCLRRDAGKARCAALFHDPYSHLRPSKRRDCGPR
jgi:Uma2 family endonuclease